MTARALAVATCAVAIGCGGGGNGGAGGSGGGAGGSSAPVEAACSLETRVGGFSVQLLEMAGNDPYASINGGVRNGIVPLEVWQQKGQAAGGCKLMAGPMLVCTTPCVSPQTCGGQNQCIDQGTLQSAGTVTVTGVGPSPITMNPLQNFYTASLVNPYPPFSPGAAVHLEAAGATIPAFAFDANGIEPLDFEPGNNLTMRNGEALVLTWTPSATAGPGRIFVNADIGHHGGIAAAIECDLPDTGSGQIPAALVSALIAEGTAGFPSLSLTRRVITSKTVGGGCVEFAIASPVEHVIGVCPTPSSCVISCDPGDPTIMCPTGTTCQDNWTCR